MTITRAAVIAEARKWIDVPYHHQGRTKFGADCIGLIVGIGHTLGFLPSEFETIVYGREPDGVTLIAEIEKYCTLVEYWQPGDLLVFRIKSNPRHLALGTWMDNINAPGMLHASNKEDGTGKVQEHILDDQFWQPRLIAAYQLPNVA